jgi:hypothetical protein
MFFDNTVAARVAIHKKKQSGKREQVTKQKLGNSARAQRERIVTQPQSEEPSWGKSLTAILGPSGG